MQNLYLIATFRSPMANFIGHVVTWRCWWTRHQRWWAYNLPTIVFWSRVHRQRQDLWGAALRNVLERRKKSRI